MAHHHVFHRRFPAFYPAGFQNPRQDTRHLRIDQFRIDQFPVQDRQGTVYPFLEKLIHRKLFHRPLVHPVNIRIRRSICKKVRIKLRQ